MKVKELFETEKEQNGTMDDFVRLVKRDCQPFISEMKNFVKPMLMYRGVNGRAHGSSGLIIPPKRRKTKHSPASATIIANFIFKKLFGIEFRTQQVFFATGSKEFAGGYGKIVAVFPKGNFKILWSPMVEDFYNARMRFIFAKDDEEKMETIVKEFEYQTGDLEKALVSENEIMVHAPEGYHFTTLTVIDDGDLFSTIIKE